MDIKGGRIMNQTNKANQSHNIGNKDKHAYEVAISSIIERYKKQFPEINNKELYKWQAVKSFQDNWNVNAEEFTTMLASSLEKADNLLTAKNYYAYKMITKFAEKEPETVRLMFVDLYSETKPLIHRYESFENSADELLAKYYSDSSKANHFQHWNAVSVYLTFRYPDKHYIYKRRVFENFAKQIGYTNIPKRGDKKSLEVFYKICDLVLAVVKEDQELLALTKSRLTKDCYEDIELHLLVQDIIYFGSRLSSAKKYNEWWPDEEDYSPGITAEQWSELLYDNSIFIHESLVIMKRMLAIGGEATCTQLSHKYGQTKNFYNVGSSALAKRIYTKTQCKLLTKNNENSKWWPILFVGKHADDTVLGSYIWKLRPELKKALIVANIQNYNDSFVDEDNQSSETKNFWWLNTNPKLWSIHSISVGDEHSYTLFNDNGNKRRIYQNFLDAKVGDLVIGYESTPVKQVVALLKVAKENDGERLFFEKLENFINPINYSSLKELPELHNSEFLNNPQGCLFKLTKPEYEIIMDVIREQNPKLKSSEVAPYTQESFLSEVYIDEQQYLKLRSLLKNKKNLIIQGPPGVGKTYMAKRLAYSIIGQKDDSKIEFVQFHQNYLYEDFIMGYKPCENGFELKHGVFYRFCQHAENNPNENFFFIIDEINRGNLSKIFGELLMLIENDYRGVKVTLAYDGLPFSVPENVYIIGMMNTADRSLALIDYALRRRFSFFDVEPAYYSDGFLTYLSNLESDIFNSVIEVITNLNKEIATDASLGPGFRIGHSYFCGQEECSTEWLTEVIDYEILPMLSEYWFDDAKKVKRWENALHGVLDD